MFLLSVYAIIKGFERFSYVGMRAILLLYLINVVGLSDDRAQEIYGGYTIVCYIASLLGGYIADNFIGARRSMLLGSILICIGHILFFYSNADEYNMVFALGAIGLGAAIFKPNCMSMIGAISDGSQDRSLNYRFYYIIFNFFNFLAPLITAYFYVYNYEYGFLVAAVAMIFVLLLLLYIWDEHQGPVLHQELEKDANRDFILLLFGCVIIVYLIAHILYDWDLLTILMYIAFIIVCIYLVYFLYGQNMHNRKSMLFVILMIVINTIFGVFKKQISKVFVLFTDRNVDLEFGGVVKLSAAVLDAVDPFTVIIFGSMSLYFFKNDDIKGLYNKLYISCIFLILAFVFMFIGASYMYNNDYLVSVFFPIISSMCLLMTEVLFYPFLTYVTNEIAPAKYKSMFLALLCYGISVSRFMSTFFAKLISNFNAVELGSDISETAMRKMTLEHYQYVFSVDIILAIITSVIIIITINTSFVRDVVDYHYNKNLLKK
ncbi:MAG: oligopeptide:H+ symporter [Pseudomonadota bacterium]